MQLDLLYVGTLPPHPGGSAVSCLQIIDGLSRAGHRVRAVAPVTRETRDEAKAIADEFPRIRFVRFEVPYYQILSGVPPAKDYRQQKGDRIRAIVQKLVDERRPDAIFVGRESFALHVPEIARIRDIPCIVRAAGGATNGIISSTYPRQDAIELLERMSSSDLVLSPAEHLSRSLRSLGCESVVTLRNMVDLNRFSPGPKPPGLVKELELDSDDVVVAHVSNLKSVKRPLDVIHSAAVAITQDPRLRYLIIGDGRLRSEMEDLCAHYGISDRFRFVGWIPQPQMPAYLRLSDMIVMASQAEGLARVYLETQACGRVLISSNIPAAREVIRDGETGLLFSLGDPNDLAAQTVRATQDPDLREQIGIQSRNRVQCHAPEMILPEYCRVLDELVLKHRKVAGSSLNPS